MAMERLNLVHGNTALRLRTFFFQAGRQAMEERMVEVRLQVLRSRFHQWSQNLRVQNPSDTFSFHFPLSNLFSDQFRQAQVQHMLSIISLPNHHDVEFWSPLISSFILSAARTAVLGNHNGFLMDIGISIRMADQRPLPSSVFQRGAELVDETLILSTDGNFGEAEPVNESVGGRGGVPAAKSSVNTLKTRNFEGEESTSACCAICLENFKTGVEVMVMPCSHEFHRTCLNRWLEQSHFCPLCRFPMPITDS